MTAVFHITADLLGQQYTFPQDIPDIAISYSIPCNWCPKMYIEQTGRTLRHQLAEHRRAVKNGDVAASVPQSTLWTQATHWTSTKLKSLTIIRTPWHDAY